MFIMLSTKIIASIQRITIMRRGVDGVTQLSSLTESVAICLFPAPGPIALAVIAICGKRVAAVQHYLYCTWTTAAA